MLEQEYAPIRSCLSNPTHRIIGRPCSSPRTADGSDTVPTRCAAAIGAPNDVSLSDLGNRAVTSKAHNAAMNRDDEILAAILTLHEATEMSFTSVDAQFTAQNTRLDRLERQTRDGFAEMHEEFAEVHGRFAEVHGGFAAQNARIDRLESEMREGFAEMRESFVKLERRRGPRGGDRS